MSNEVNERIKEDILEEIYEMADKDIWNVIFAIQNEFGIENMPSPTGGEHGFIAKLFELRLEERLV